MKKTILSIIALTGMFVMVNAQTGSVGINTTLPDKDSDLTLGSTNKGLRLNKVALLSTINPSPLSAHVAGMTVYNTATAGTGTVAVTPGEYYNDGTQWVKKAGQAPTFNPTQNVFVNGADPNSATQFDDVNYYDNTTCIAPATGFTHDSALMALTDALYIGQSACDANGDGVEYSYWIYDGTKYIPYTTPASTEWYLAPTLSDAGSNKTSIIHRPGYVIIGDAKPINKGYSLSVWNRTLISQLAAGSTAFAGRFSIDNNNSANLATVHAVNATAANSGTATTLTNLFGGAFGASNLSATKTTNMRVLSGNFNNAAAAGAFNAGQGLLINLNNFATTTDAITTFRGTDVSLSHSGGSAITTYGGLYTSLNQTNSGYGKNLLGVDVDVNNNTTSTASTASSLSIGARINNTQASTSFAYETLEGIRNTMTISGKSTNYKGLSNVVNVTSTTNNNNTNSFGLYNLNQHAVGTNANYTDLYGLYSYNNYRSSGLAQELYGARIITYNGSSNTGTVSNQYGVFNDNTMQGANVITNSYGLKVGQFVGSLQTGNVTNSYGIHVDANMSPASTATLTNQYGLYIANITGATNNWAIYSAGGDSYHAGKIGIGAAAVKTPTAQVHIDTDSATQGLRIDKITGNGGLAQIYLNEDRPLSSAHAKHIQLANGTLPQVEIGSLYGTTGMDYFYISTDTTDVGTSAHNNSKLVYLVNSSTKNTSIGGAILNPDCKLEVNGYIKVGTSDATGDATPTPGMIRYNNTTAKFQGYAGAPTNAWVDLN